MVMILDKKLSKKERERLEKAFGVVLKVREKEVEVSGKGEEAALHEYEAENALRALSLGFSAEEALLLKEENCILEEISLKKKVKPQHLSAIKARLIGKKGRIKKRMEELSGCKIVLHDNTLAILGKVEDIESARDALSTIIRGGEFNYAFSKLEKA